jgi:hypothetical protein
MDFLVNIWRDSNLFPYCSVNYYLFSHRLKNDPIKNKSLISLCISRSFRRFRSLFLIGDFSLNLLTALKKPTCSNRSKSIKMYKFRVQIPQKYNLTVFITMFFFSSLSYFLQLPLKIYPEFLTKF